MVLFEEALKIVLNCAKVQEKERVDILSSLHRVLAEDVYSDLDMPPFNKSAMDGFACKLEDLDKALLVIETIPAGKFPELIISSGTCSRIMTGAPLPDGADCVIMVEETEEIAPNQIRFTGTETKKNISTQGSDIRNGDLVISQGSLIKPQHIAVLATVGKSTMDVFKQPKIGIMATGDELVEPFKIPSKSQIRNCNAWQLITQTVQNHALPKYYGIAKDDFESLEYMINLAISENDVVILSGGVSAGDFDFVPSVFEKINIKILFDSIAIQPGKPSTFGVRDNKAIFGLPGNPVSAFFQFEFLIRPFILAMMGNNEIIQELSLELGSNYSRKKSSITSLVPVNIDLHSKVYPIEYHGSAHINAMTFANGIMIIPVGETFIKQGSTVHVRQI